MKKPRHKKARSITFKNGEFKTKSRRAQKFMEQSGAKLFIENIEPEFKGIIPHVMQGGRIINEAEMPFIRNNPAFDKALKDYAGSKNIKYQPTDEKSYIGKKQTNFHIEENLSVIANENVFNAERYYVK